MSNTGSCYQKKRCGQRGSWPDPQRWAKLRTGTKLIQGKAKQRALQRRSNVNRHVSRLAWFEINLIDASTLCCCYSGDGARSGCSSCELTDRACDPRDTSVVTTVAFSCFSAAGRLSPCHRARSVPAERPCPGAGPTPSSPPRMLGGFSPPSRAGPISAGCRSKSLVGLLV